MQTRTELDVLFLLFLRVIIGSQHCRVSKIEAPMRNASCNSHVNNACPISIARFSSTIHDHFPIRF